MSLTTAMDSAISSLSLAQQQISTISTNISNASSPGYTRKILPQTTRVADGVAIGVASQAVIRQVDLNLVQDLWTQHAAVGELQTKQVYFDRIQKFHGTIDSESSIAAYVSNLRDSFSALADLPQDEFLQSATVDQADILADKINNFSTLLNDLRRQSDQDIADTVSRINALLEEVAATNNNIVRSIALDKSTAELEDQRDRLVKELAGYIDVSTFKRGDGTMVVQTRNGLQLADVNAEELYFSATNLGPTQYYPDDLSGLFVGGNPATNVASIDIADQQLGGKVGGLLEIRDSDLPRYQAQIDELAHKLAVRFNAQGLTLFTDAAGQIPADTAPDPDADPVQPVSYVGFANEITVNPRIVNNPGLLQSGTYTSDVTIPAGSNEVIRRVIEYSFGSTSYQQATGTRDIRVASSGSADLQEHLGLYARAEIVSGVDLRNFTEIDSGGADASDIVTTFSDFTTAYPADDTFRITFSDRLGVAQPAIDIALNDLVTDGNYDIGDADPSGTLTDGTIDNAADQLVAYINDQIAAAGLPADLNPSASLNSYGQIVFRSRGDITFTAFGFANNLGDEAFRAIFGFEPGTVNAADPSFDVQIGSRPPQTVTIAAGETEADLRDKLQKLSGADAGVAGLMVDDTAFAAGTLTLRPGIDETALGGPSYGGDIRLVAGPVEADGSGVAASGDDIITAIFGSANPVSNIQYGSEISSSDPAGIHFRADYLGPGANISTGITGVSSLIDFAQSVLNSQTRDATTNNSRIADEENFRNTLEQQFLNESAVNLDEEMAQLITQQNAFAASARALTTITEMFDELINIL